MPWRWAVCTRLPQILAGAEMRIDVQEVLDAVAVVSLLIRHLLEDRADPHGGDPQALQVADLAGQPFQRAAGPMAACLAPAGGIGLALDGVAGVAGLEERGAPAGHQLAVVAAEALFAAIRKAVEHQEIQHLILPGTW